MFSLGSPRASMSRADSAVTPSGGTSAPTLIDAIAAKLDEWHLLVHGIHMAMMEVAHASAVSIVKQPHSLGARVFGPSASTLPFVVEKSADGNVWRYIRIWPQQNCTLTVEMPSGPMQISLGPANAPALPLPDGARIICPSGNVNAYVELTDYAD